MAKQLQAIRGMHDILPADMPVWRQLEGEYRNLIESYGYREVRTPLLERTALFARSIGEATDIVDQSVCSRFWCCSKAWDAAGCASVGPASARTAATVNDINASGFIGGFLMLSLEISPAPDHKSSCAIARSNPLTFSISKVTFEDLPA